MPGFNPNYPGLIPGQGAKISLLDCLLVSFQDQRDERAGRATSVRMVLISDNKTQPTLVEQQRGFVGSCSWEIMWASGMVPSGNHLSLCDSLWDLLLFMKLLPQAIFQQPPGFFQRWRQMYPSHPFHFPSTVSSGLFWVSAASQSVWFYMAA